MSLKTLTGEASPKHTVDHVIVVLYGVMTEKAKCDMTSWHQRHDKKVLSGMNLVLQSNSLGEYNACFSAGLA